MIATTGSKPIFKARTARRWPCVRRLGHLVSKLVYIAVQEQVLDRYDVEKIFCSSPLSST